MDPKYLIGIPEMDAQHARLLELAERARGVVAEEGPMDEIVLQLINYANAHLDQEEEFLRQSGLADFLVGHGKKHVAFRSQAMDFYNSFREAEGVDAKFALVGEITRFCEAWLIEHIHVEDRRYAEQRRSST